MIKLDNLLDIYLFHIACAKQFNLQILKCKRVICKERSKGLKISLRLSSHDYFVLLRELIGIKLSSVNNIMMQKHTKRYELQKCEGQNVRSLFSGSGLK